MIEFLRESAARDPSSVAVITDSEEVTYGDLLTRSEAIAAGLAERGIERFGIVHQDAAVVIALLAGSSLAGAEACPYPPLDQADPHDLATLFDHDVVVSDEEVLDVDAAVIRPADLEAASASPPAEPPSQRPFMALTTGTTGVPKGVRHDWWRFLSPVIKRFQAGSGSDQRWLFTYGLHQFGGLGVLMQVTAGGATLIATWPRRPPDGLAAARRHGVTHISSTPTYMRFFLAEMRSDGEGAPTGIKQIVLAGEAVPNRLLPDLEEVFPGVRISQVYGTLEYGRGGAVHDNQNGLPVSVLEHDENSEIALKIVDGELWIRSRVGMLGYYGEDPIDPDEWRRTGDLVEIRDDRIFFHGRVSDVINVGGVKVHPLAVEEAIANVPGVVMCRVFGRANPLTGQVVAAEVEAEDGVDTDELEQAIRAACDELPRVSRPRSIRFVEGISTAGQKIMRRA